MIIFYNIGFFVISFCIWLAYINKIKVQLSYSYILALTWASHYLLSAILIGLHQFLGIGNINDKLDLNFLLYQFGGILFLIGFIASYRDFIEANQDKRIIRYNKKQFITIVYFAIIAGIFGIIFVYVVGLSAYFNSKLALYGNTLQEYVEMGKGIGYYYYPMLLVFPCALLLLTYAIQNNNKGYWLLAILYFLFYQIITIPLGGRGRSLSVLIFIILIYLIEHKVTRFVNFRNSIILSCIFIIAIAWGNIRGKEKYDMHDALQDADISQALMAQTRYTFLSYIFSKYPPEGYGFGRSYLEAALGPLGERILPDILRFDLIQDVSQKFFMDRYGFESRSAISPTFIGELYINFGIIGLLISGPLFATLLKLFNLVMPGQYSLNRAWVIYFGAHMCFNGGVYPIFEVMWTFLPIWIVHNYHYRGITIVNKRICPHYRS